MAASQFAYAQPQQLYAESGLQGQQYGGLQGQLGLQGQGGLQGLQGQGGQGQQVLLLAPGQQQQQQQLGGYTYGLNPYVLQNAGGQQQLIGAGAGVRVPAGPEVQQLYANRKGGPAFFDSTTGVFFDGQQAYVYQAAPYGARSSGSLLNGGLQGLQGQGGQGQQVLLLAPGQQQQQQQLGGYAYGLNPYVLQNAGGQQQLIGAGAGVRVPAGPEVQQLYANRKGGPAFFDSTTGVFFDGQQAYVYQAAPYGARSSGSLLNVATAVPLSGTGISASGGRLLIGNGTVGNLEEHRNARGSVYILDNRL
ncbi:hypothetical protein AAVH_05677 [Aphelenchoides avenae]|nr:hypothetical protein AAVH_05677 [Aphelenchus avenae]